MRNKLLLSLLVILLIATQACKKKEEAAPVPTFTQIDNVNLDLNNQSLADLSTGKAYDAAGALADPTKIDMAYLKSAIFTDSTNNPVDTAYKLIISPHLFTSFVNQSLFVPAAPGATAIKDITDGAELKTMFDAGVAASPIKSSSAAIVGLVPNVTVMFNIRTQTTTPLYGGIFINSISADSSIVNVSVTVQK